MAGNGNLWIKTRDDILSDFMSIHELLAKFPADKLKVQFVDQCLSQINAVKHGATITLRTDAMTPSQVATGDHAVGIIVWVPRELWKNRNG